ncbi:MAG TPA: BRO family protein [Candidatus Nanoarchaeia archaeon]|nr:BRO family protein [Candidatus Nanoarchaeia archaeon]
MEKEIISRLKKSFEDYANEADGLEFWFARDLQNLLDYDEWRNFLNVIEKAKTVCEKSGQNIKDHFVEVNKKVTLKTGSRKGFGGLQLEMSLQMNGKREVLERIPNLVTTLLSKCSHLNRNI